MSYDETDEYSEQVCCAATEKTPYKTLYISVKIKLSSSLEQF